MVDSTSNKQKFSRVFIGIPLPENTKKQITSVLKQIKLNLSKMDIRWVSPENYHLTLNFLGSIENERIPCIKLCMEKAIENINPFNLEFSKLLFLPHPRNPKIISISVHLIEPLGILYANLNKALEEYEFPIDPQPFLPHITIGRLKQINSMPDDVQTPKINGTFQVNSLVLFESITKETGAEYKPYSHNENDSYVVKF